MRIEFLGVEILTQPFLGAGPGSWEGLLQPSQQQELRAAGIPGACPGITWARLRGSSSRTGAEPPEGLDQGLGTGAASAEQAEIPG